MANFGYFKSAWILALIVWRVSLACVCQNTLSTQLFPDYISDIRPVRDTKQRTNINFGIYLLSLDDVDLKTQTISVTLILDWTWTDEYLQWEPQNFHNLTELSINAHYIWLPDITVGNDNGVMSFVSPHQNEKAVLYHNGTVRTWPYFSGNLGVSIDVSKFPFDTQKLVFEFYSWTVNNENLVLYWLPEQTVQQMFQSNGEWELVNYDMAKLNKSFGELVSYSVLRCTITVKRKWLYLVMKVICPVVLTSLLNPVSFLLPVESGERISLSNTVFLTLAVFFTIVSDSLPEASDGVPLIVMYMGLQLIGSALSVIFTVISLNIHNKKGPINNFALRLLSHGVNKPLPKGSPEHKSSMKSSLTGEITDSVGNEICKSTILSTIESELRWKLLSRKLDNFCFWASLIWNSLLILFIIYAKYA